MKPTIFAIAMTLVGCATIAGSSPRDLSRQILQLDKNAPVLNNTDRVCVKTGLFGKCKQYELQVINRYDLTLPEVRKELTDRNFHCMSFETVKIP